MTSFKKFTLFSSLPLECRQRIWYYALPGPRALLIKRNIHYVPPPKSKIMFSISRRLYNPKRWSKYIVDTASWGGRHPVILSVNHESRTEALHHLTFLLGTYWNLDLDSPYFEFSGAQAGDWYRDLMLVKEMRVAGELDAFRNIAFDWDFLFRYQSLTAESGGASKFEHP
jgi:hypothetical protein